MAHSAQTPHRTPLRRISQGSLFRLSRSGAYPDAPHGLGFLEPAMTEFLDETEALQTNLEGMKHLSDSLQTFNESFASWLYVMNMNALTTDWVQAPGEESFQLAQRRAEKHAIEAAEALKRAQEDMLAAQQREHEEEAQRQLADRTAFTEITDVDTTYMGNTTNASGKSGSTVAAKKNGVKPGAKVKMTAKEKKERSIELERIVSCLPLEFRGSDPSLRRNMESVLEGLMNAPGNTVKLPDLIKPPDLNQARVNKCLIALVNRKAVKKDNSSGTVMYRWIGIP
ncbi:hypothetical protein FA15DRAFT_674069 [Coprinopsis marcescibilis]|uniref:DASH complex subunit DAM1 n=1 Tax=Coprinopsis marcescibilis TaxID=230819 RepID=A0A5C3KJ11_COPMA|nr:hypothetical protein FA15DRAFT_674069 [Coprinopsis marcescibilis]